MGYLFLALALACGAVKGYCGKKSSGTLTCISDALLVNTVRMLFCICIGGAIVTVDGAWSAKSFDGMTFFVSALSGIATAVFTVTWLMSVQRSAYMLVDVFLLCGVILPIFLCALFFGESISLSDGLGILLLIVAAYLMCTYNRSVQKKVGAIELVLLLLCALANGTVDFSQKLFVKTVGGNIALFNFLTYAFAAVALGVVYLILRCKNAKGQCFWQGTTQVLKPILGYVAVMAVCLFLHSFFKTMAAQTLSAVEIYPISQGGSLILSMLMAALLFREKINARCISGVVLAFAALLIIHLL